jgi:hypothetical protein
MRPIPPKLREEMASDPYYKVCARLNDGPCGGKITWEHALIHSGRQINAKWAIIPLCCRHHGVNEWQDKGSLCKEKNVIIALNRATDEELREVSKAVDYLRLREHLNKKYGGGSA